MFTNDCGSRICLAGRSTLKRYCHHCHCQCRQSKGVPTNKQIPQRQHTTHQLFHKMTSTAAATTTPTTTINDTDAHPRNTENTAHNNDEYNNTQQPTHNNEQQHQRQHTTHSKQQQQHRQQHNTHTNINHNSNNNNNNNNNNKLQQ